MTAWRNRVEETGEKLQCNNDHFETTHFSNCKSHLAPRTSYGNRFSEKSCFYFLIVNTLSSYNI